MFATYYNYNYTYPQAIQHTDEYKFIGAMVVEVAAHKERDHCAMVPQSSLSVGAKKIRSIWSLKIKRFPDGPLNKNKAIICDQGGMKRWG